MVSMFSKLNACISPECYFWCYHSHNTTIYFSDITRTILVYTYTIHTGAENTTIVQPVCLHKWSERNRIPRIFTVFAGKPCSCSRAGENISVTGIFNTGSVTFMIFV